MVNELDMSRDLSRLIVHVDMDAFYAAVEMRDCPELKDKPMAVGSMSMLVSGGVTARMYTTVQKFGITKRIIFFPLKTHTFIHSFQLC